MCDLKSLYEDLFKTFYLLIKPMNQKKHYTVVVFAYIEKLRNNIRKSLSNQISRSFGDVAATLVLRGELRMESKVAVGTKSLGVLEHMR